MDFSTADCGLQVIVISCRYWTTARARVPLTSDIPVRDPTHIKGCYELSQCSSNFYLLQTLRLAAAVERPYLSFQVHSFDQASVYSITANAGLCIFLHVLHSAIPLISRLLSDYCHSQCGTAGFLEPSRLWCCRCSSHLMLLSGACAG